MDTLADFHPGIQYAIRRLANPSLTFDELGRERGISKQAVQKQYRQARDYLRGYNEVKPEPAELKPCVECGKREGLISTRAQDLAAL